MFGRETRTSPERGSGRVGSAKPKTHDNDSNVTVIDGSSNTVTASIPVGPGPSSVAFDSGNGQLFVSNYGSENVSVIQSSDNKVVAAIPVQSSPSFVAVDSANGAIYVTNINSASMSVLSGSNDSVTTTVSTGNSPFAVAIDPIDGDVYVANIGSGTVSVLPGAPVWSTSISFTVPAGAHYLFHVTKPSKYRAAPQRGHIGIPQHSVEKRLKFRLDTAEVVFSESGLRPHQHWQVNISGPTDVRTSSSSRAIRFSLVNGSYAFSVSGVSGYGDSPMSGSFVVTVPHPTLRFRIMFSPMPAAVRISDLSKGPGTPMLNLAPSSLACAAPAPLLARVRLDI
jgi:YVTN family beta-propeller protein